MYCRNCGGLLTPSAEFLNSSDPYYHGGARCRGCNYLYYPEVTGTWYPEAWDADYYRRADVILKQTYTADDPRRDAQLALHFIDCLQEKMVTWYHLSPNFNEHERLAEVLRSLGAVKTFEILERVVRMGECPDEVLERFGLVGDTSENVDDAWEAVTNELWESVDPDLRKRVYDRYMRDHDVAEFVAE